MRVKCLPAVSITLVDCLRRKSERGETPSPLWARLVRTELARCARHIDTLSVSERVSACELLDWYIGFVAGDCDESWLSLYPLDERELRTSAALLDWYCRRLSSLNHFERGVLIDMAEDYFATTGNFRDSWRSIYEF